MAFDEDRQWVLSYDPSSRLLSSVSTDGTLHASTALVSPLENLFVNRASGTYVVIDGLFPLFRRRELDSNLIVIGQCRFRLQRNGPRFAIDSGGVVYVLHSDPSLGVCVSLVEVATGQMTTLLAEEQLIHDRGTPCGMLIDSHDVIVVWFLFGRVATYSAQGRLLSVFDCGDTPYTVRVSAEGIFAIHVLVDDTVRILSADGRLLRCHHFERSSISLCLLSWTNEHLLVLDGVKKLCWLC
eukprot:TRINITY_DN4298_c1_g1_i1.p1 TRINITY_DN4298_c1_g1~~TRINITY_DN4298_c1_g1_i1.p1  ORF type:complete len:240 (+),score=4.66 TRINITY_DN4298_c1_g1_i1:268-987(+)